MKKEDKSTVIGQIAATIEEYSNFYLTNISTLNAADTSNIRRECFKENIKLVVVKNTLFKKALEQAGSDFSQLNVALKGNTAVMFSNNANGPAKLIKSFSKRKDLPKLKAAYVQEGFYIGEENLEILFSIKSKKELIGDVIALLQSPAKNVISALSSGGQTIHGVLKTLIDR
jgi:large subunit ribosomal protein L10